LKAPILDRFEKVDRCFSAAGWTLPSVASILTGNYPSAHGLIDHNQVLDRKTGLISEILRDRGYRTAAFVENKNLQEYFGFGRGFDIYHNEFLHTVEPDPTPDTIQLKGTAGTGNTTDHHKIFDTALDFIRNEKDYFLFFHSNMVHDFYLDHTYYGENRLFPGGVPHNVIKSAGFWRSVSNEDIESLVERYDNGVRTAMDRVKEMLDNVDLENTLVAIMSDHGEGFDNHRFHHCGRLHNDLLHVPLFFHFPDNSSLKDHNAVSTIDVLPTILDHLGIGYSCTGGFSLKRDIPDREIHAMDSAYLYFGAFSGHMPMGLLMKEPDNMERERLTYKSRIPFQINATIDRKLQKSIATQIGENMFFEAYDLKEDFTEKDGVCYGPAIVKKRLPSAPARGSHIKKRIYMGFDRNASHYRRPLEDELSRDYRITVIERDDDESYVDIAHKVAESIDGGSAGILFCGNGIGVSVVANKHDGIYAARCTTVEDAVRSRKVNNSNVLCLGAETGLDNIRHIIQAWLETGYEGRKQENLEKIALLENSF
jgi:ribose 5-phosphate isomerase B